MKRGGIVLNKMYSIQIDDIVWKLFAFSYGSKRTLPNDKMLHVHSHAELFVCLQGSIQLNFAEESIILNQNDVCLVPLGVKHAKKPDTGEGALWGALGLVCSKGGSRVKNSKSLDPHVSSMLYGDRICIFRDNADLCRIGQTILLDEAVNTAILLELLCHVYKAATDRATEEIAVSRHREAKDIERLLILDSIINVEYANNLSNEEIAHRLSISPRQLSRFVLAHFDTTLHKLFTKQRLISAAVQLRETDGSIEAICHSVGFSNKTFFYQKFKEEFGVTPVQYRKTAK